MDRAEVLSPATRQALERRLAAYERDTAHQIVVHTTPSLEGLPIEEYSIRVAEAWQVGHEGLDNGAILTVAPEERKVRIEVGYGLEGVVPDAIASRIVRETILPAFQRGDLEGGIVAGVERLQQAAAGEAIPAERRPATRPQRRPSGGGGGFPIWTWLLVLLIFGGRGLFFLPFLGGMGAGRRVGYHGRRHGGFGGGGFGGGFGGGGGGFGGGGASGSW